MADFTIVRWPFANITTTGPDPFSDGSDPNNSAPGNSTITIDAPPINHVITDNDDDELRDGDSNGQLSGGGDPNDLEYSYIVRPQGSSDPADNITVYAHEIDGTIEGIVADAPLKTGVTYDIIAIETASPSPTYASLFVCYAPGTLIRTQTGDVRVEDLNVGDLLVTADNGLQPLRWIGHRGLRFPEGPHKQKPIEIKPGSLGGGLPRRRLVVSPQHRMLLSGAVVENMFDTHEVLALGKGLVGLDHIRAMNGKREVTYYSILCDRHEVIMAEGAWSETFYPGPTALEMLGPKMRQEVETLFPVVRDDPDSGYGPRARRVLTRKETETLVDALLARGFGREDDEIARWKRRAEHAKWDEDLARESAAFACPALRVVT